MKLCTIGFTQKSADRFFGLLAEARVTRLVDIRLKPGGQLSGFANSRDLPFFLERQWTFAACATSWPSSIMAA